MYSQDEIEDAVAAGALAPDQAASLRAYVAQRNRTPTPDEEYNRALRGYNDIFAATACFFALIAAGWLGSKIPLGARGGGFNPQVIPVMAAVFVAAASWGLAELFVRRRRTALPAYLLSFSFGLAVFATPMMILGPNVSGAAGSVIGAFSAVVAGLATWGFWVRFRAVFAPTVAVGLVVLGIAILLGTAFAGSGSGIGVLNFVLLLIGVGVFAFALWWDLGDPWRITERNEVGLWLHWLASLLVIYPASYLFGLYSGGAGSVVIGVLLFVLLSLVGLIVNRKVIVAGATAPLMTSLIIILTGNAMSPFAPSPFAPYGAMGGMGGRGGGADDMFLTFAIIGVILLGLALGWSRLRQGIVGILPYDWQQKFPAAPVAAPAYHPADPPETPPYA